MRRTSLHDAARAEGAVFAEIDGWEMPRAFAGVAAEHRALSAAAAAVDVGHRGRLRIGGAKRLDLLHRITTNDVRGLAAGEGAVTVLCTDKGRIVDRLAILAEEGSCLVETSPNRAARIRETIEKVRFRDDVTPAEVTAETAQIALIGPAAGAALAAAGARVPEGGAPYRHLRTEIGGAPVLAARVPAPGAGGFHLHAAAADGPAVRRALLASGAALGVVPAGAEAFEILRVESGEPLWGRELIDDFNPLEARLEGAVSWTKGCYTGQEVIARLDSRNKLQKLLVGLVVDEGAVPEPRSRIFAGKLEVGVVTSVAPSLALGRVVALGYVRTAQAEPGTRLEIHSAGAAIGAAVAGLPFPRS